MGFRVEQNVMVPMRDGTLLATDIWIPEGTPCATLVVRVPYGKSAMFVLSLRVNPDIFTLLDAGYAVVRQDCRGTSASDGDFVPMENEHDDGVDTVEWVREQPWSNGVVGAFGASYLGFTQLALASKNPPGLAAIAPSVTNPDLYRAWHSDGGALTWHNAVFWATSMGVADVLRSGANGDGDRERLQSLLADVTALQASPDTLLRDAMPADRELLAELHPWWSEWLQHPGNDDFWHTRSPVTDHSTVMVPALHIGGWFDLFAGDTTRTYARLRSEAGTEHAREGQQLVMGPWDHQSYTGMYKDRQFGPTADIAAIDITSTYLRFYDKWLRNTTDTAGAAPVRIFVMGIDEWRDEEDWPLPDTTYVEYFLDSSGDANSSDGGGAISRVLPATEASDSYTYDPTSPVPSLGGRVWQPSALNLVGPVDQSDIEKRDDVLCYTTPVLSAAVEVTGHVSLVLHVTSSASDTDFTGKLVDVHPDGRAIYLTDGMLRVRYRDTAGPQLMAPGTVYEITLDLSVTSNVFLPGHRIRLEVSSSAYPRYDRNTNTGGDINEEGLHESVVAQNRVIHGPDHRSRLILPIIER
ncbi:CocE/NonD family hydrolase [Rhodococcus sp. NBC_00294]|uniref:CocE/NonD family hydrolase n=1 Tax=Rhodococcus sp. NBC_00294 TaxID=2976004 RepID=UPI002E2B7289|nr:CocE/NonD family hydrolase [Rhodococcus sp. NBC_00294]